MSTRVDDRPRRIDSGAAEGAQQSEATSTTTSTPAVTTPVVGEGEGDRFSGRASSRRDADGRGTEAAIAPASGNTGSGSVSAACRDLSKTLEEAVAKARPPVTAANARRLRERLLTLDALLTRTQARTPADARRLVQAYVEIGRELASQNLLGAACAKQLLGIRAEIIAKLGGDLGMQLKLVEDGGRALAVSVAAPASRKEMSALQLAAFDAARVLVFESERLRVSKTPLTFQDIALLDLRDALLRRLLELSAPKDPGDIGSPTRLEDMTGPRTTEAQLLAGAIAKLDQIQDARTSLPPNVLAPLVDLGQRLEAASPGALGATLREALGPAGDAPTVPQVPAGAGRSATAAASGFARRALQVREAQQVPLTAPAAPLGIAAPLEAANTSLLQVLANAPFGVHDDASAGVKSLSEGLAALHRTMPPLPPFTYRLSRPMTLDDGRGHRIDLPPGATLSRASDGTYSVDSPGLAMTSGGTAFTSRHGVIKLGKDADSFRFDNLTTTSAAGRTTALSAVEGQIDHTRNTGVIRADEAVIDLANGGKASFTNAAFVVGEDSTGVTASSLLVQEEGERIALEGLALTSQRGPSGETLTASGTNADVAVGTTAFTARKLDVTFDRGTGPGAAESMKMHAEGLHLVTGDGTACDAAASNIEVLRRADGSSHVAIAGDTMNVAAAGSRIATTGPTTLAADYGPNGKLRALTASGADVRYTDANGSAVTAKNGDVKLGFDDAGRLASANAKASELTYAGGGQNVRANDGTMALTYSEGRLTQAVASAKSASYQGGSGNATATNGSVDLKLNPDGSFKGLSASGDHATYAGKSGNIDVTKGSLELTAGPGGLLRQASARADAATFRGSAGDFTVTNGSAAATFSDAGIIQSARLEAGSGTFTRQGTSALVRDGAANMTFGPDGSLQAFDGRAGHLDLTSAGTHVLADGTTVTGSCGPNGVLKQVAATNGSAVVGGAFGSMTAKNTKADLSFYSDGTLQRASSTVGELELTAKKGDKVNIKGGAAQLELAPDGTLRRAEASAGDLTASGSFGDVTAHGRTAVAITAGANGTLSAVNANAEQLTYTRAGQAIDVRGGTMSAALDAGGKLSTLDASAERVTRTEAGTTLLVNGGTAHAEFSNGTLTRMTAGAGSGSFTGDFGTLDIPKGGNLAATYKDGRLSTVHGDVTQLHYAGDKGALKLAGGVVDGNVSEDGKAFGLELTAKRVELNGSSSFGQGAAVTFNNTAVRVASDSTGQRLALSGSDGQMTIDGRRIGIEAVEKLEIATDADGAITGIEGRFPGAITYDEASGKLHASVTGLAVSGSVTEGTKLNVAFDQAGARLEGAGVTATIKGGELKVTDRLATFHIEDAELMRSLEGELPFKGTVQGVDLTMSVGAAGDLQSATAALRSLEGRYGTTNISFKAEDGKQFRLETEFAANGTQVRRVFYQIPEGGELEVATDSMRVRLGPQAVALTPTGNGGLELSARDFSAYLDKGTRDDGWSKLHVEVKGAEADVALDPSRGLVFNRVSGTHISLKSSKYNADIDIKQLDNLLFRMTRVEGLAQGAAIELVPTGTGKDSKLTMRVHVSYKGIPITLNLDNLGAFKAGVGVDVNQAHVYMLDPTGQGKITLTAGPLGMLKAEGSAIEYFAKYREFDPGRMYSCVTRWMSRDGLRLTKGVSVDSDGVVRVGTTGNGLHTELSVLLPRAQGALPAYLFNVGGKPGSDPGGSGFIVNVGGAGTTGAGTRYVGSVFIGALPGSYVDIRQTKGDTYLFGIPIGHRWTIPTTATAGVQFSRDSRTSHLDVTAGAYANPAYFAAPSSGGMIREPSPGGVYGGVHYSDRRVDIGVEGMLQVEQNGPGGRLKPGAGNVQVTLGFRFQ